MGIVSVYLVSWSHTGLTWNLVRQWSDWGCMMSCPSYHHRPTKVRTFLTDMQLFKILERLDVA